MNFSLKPHQLVAHWVPGFLLLMVIAVLHPSASEGVKALLPHSDALSGFVLAVLAFAIGQLLDAVRDLCENIWDRWDKVDWDFFFEAKPEQIEKLDGSYFTYYVFNSNLVLPLLYFSLGRLISGHYAQFALALAADAFFIVDARCLRKEIARHTRARR